MRLVARFGTFPGFNLPVHGVLMTLPVVFTAEAARTAGVGAAVGAGVSLLMFSVQYAISANQSFSIIIERLWQWYFNSH